MGQAENDKQLVARVQNGDRDAYDLLVIKYQNRVVKIVNGYVKDSAECFDVAQEVFIKAYKAIGKFRGDSAFYTWLYRIAINTSKNFVTSQRRKYEVLDADIGEEGSQDMSQKSIDNASPESLMLKDEIQDVIVKTIRNLPDELRTAITLRELEGMSYDEIADVMGCPIGTVRSRLFRAREAIDEKLKPLTNPN